MMTMMMMQLFQSEEFSYQAQFVRVRCAPTTPYGNQPTRTRSLIVLRQLILTVLIVVQGPAQCSAGRLSVQRGELWRQLSLCQMHIAASQ